MAVKMRKAEPLPNILKFNIFEFKVAAKPNSTKSRSQFSILDNFHKLKKYQSKTPYEESTLNKSIKPLSIKCTPMILYKKKEKDKIKTNMSCIRSIYEDSINMEFDNEMHKILQSNENIKKFLFCKSTLNHSYGNTIRIPSRITKPKIDLKKYKGIVERILKINKKINNTNMKNKIYFDIDSLTRASRNIDMCKGNTLSNHHWYLHCN